MKQNKLLVVGSARCVWDDLQKIWTEIDDYDVMCVNDMISYFPGKIRYGYSNDWEMLPRWLDSRRPENKKLDETVDLYSCFGYLSKHPKVKNIETPGSGTSSLNAVLTGIYLGYEEILVAGVPLDNTGHFFDPPWKRTNFEREVPKMRGDQLRYWSYHQKETFNGRVRSLSGRTREALAERVVDISAAHN